MEKFSEILYGSGYFQTLTEFVSQCCKDLQRVAALCHIRFLHLRKTGNETTKTNMLTCVMSPFPSPTHTWCYGTSPLLHMMLKDIKSAVLNLHYLLFRGHFFVYNEKKKSENQQCQCTLLLKRNFFPKISYQNKCLLPVIVQNLRLFLRIFQNGRIHMSPLLHGHCISTLMR